MALVANTTLRVTELEPDKIAETLKDVFKSDTVFQDYNFEGSALSMLLDVLKHDTYYSAFYLNMLFNEAFLDSAIRRTSVVSRAKELGYTPRSARGASASIRVTINPNDAPASILIAKGTRFRGSTQGYKYVFQTTQDVTVVPSSGVYQADLDLVEGDAINQTYNVPSGTNSLIVRLINPNIDVNTLVVRVKLNSTSTVVSEWKRAPDILEATATSEIYYLCENMDGYYELEFGNNVLRKTSILSKSNINIISCSKWTFC